jgi:hypothetical protein
MIGYPQIPLAAGQSFRAFTAYLFDKLDGRHVRAFWSKKRGWERFGTRELMFDASEPEYGPAIALFHSTLAEPLAKIATDHRWRELVVFVEYWGPGSLAGLDVKGPGMRVDLLDADAAGPRWRVRGTHFRGRRRQGRRRPRSNHVEGEDGCVASGRARRLRARAGREDSGELTTMGKRPEQTRADRSGVRRFAAHGRDRIMSKAKTAVWRQAVRDACAPELAEKILES